MNHILGPEIGWKQNILVMNDEAHHAYRIKQAERNGDENEGDKDDAEEFYKEADGLDRWTRPHSEIARD